MLVSVYLVDRNLNVHATAEKLGPSRDTIGIINGCLLHGKMENIKIKLVFKSPLLKANLGLIVQNFMIL
jgi:hypothetical protein